MKKPLSNFGKIIRAKRALSRISLSKLAKEIGCSSSYLSSCELGTKTLSEDIALKIAKYFNFTITQTIELLQETFSDRYGLYVKLDNPQHKKLNSMFIVFIHFATIEQKLELLEFLNKQLGIKE